MPNHQQFLVWIADGKLARIRLWHISNSMQNSFLAVDMEDHRFIAAVKNDDPSDFDWAHMSLSLDAELVNINGIMVPAAEKKSPRSNVRFYVPSPEHEGFTRDYTWDGGAFDQRVLERGLVHLSAINARMHAKAMLGNGTEE